MVYYVQGNSVTPADKIEQNELHDQLKKRKPERDIWCVTVQRERDEAIKEAELNPQCSEGYARLEEAIHVLNECNSYQEEEDGKRRRAIAAFDKARTETGP